MMNTLATMLFWFNHHPLYSAALFFLAAALAVTLYTWVQDGTIPSKERAAKRAC